MLKRSERLQFRTGLAADWTNSTYVLAVGEPGFESDTGFIKIGNGVDLWPSLSYVVVSTSATAPSFTDLTVTGTLTTQGGVVRAYTTKSSSGSVSVDDHVVVCTSGTFTLTLPSASGITGQDFLIQNSGSGVITVDGAGSETVNGELTQSLYEWESIRIVSTGSGWVIV